MNGLRGTSAFERLCAAHGRHLPLDEACALVAAEENSETSAEALLAELDSLAAQVRPRAGATSFDGVSRLHWLLFTHLGFTGDTESYDHPHNSLLDRVLVRRRGLPILLCVLYIEVARRVGLEVDAIGWPGHFLVRPVLPGERLFVDPFNQGRVLRAPALRERLAFVHGAPAGDDRLRLVLSPVDARYVLVRLNNNLKASLLRRGEVPGALRAVERMLLLAPELIEERRDRGLMRLHLGQTDTGLEDLRTYLEARPDAPDRARVEARLARVKRA